MEALNALSVKRVVRVNPYPAELNDAVVATMTTYGFDFQVVSSLRADFTRIGDVLEADVYAAAKRAVQQSPRLGGLYPPCPQLPALDVIETIESDFQIPAVGHLPQSFG
jgi:maleate cis-trans isomerase